jgi:hypothetical protein
METAPLKMRRFLTEFHYAAGSDRLFGSNLPDPSHMRHSQVVMPRETVLRFRNDMLLLLNFAALACGKSVEELCPFDLMAPFLKRATDSLEDEDDLET